tara:strand:+ start:339 stop:530 length:192 start_codon:yes stop_codon:yes gene_type:complete
MTFKIICPKCIKEFTLYNLDWIALLCIHCKKEISKNEIADFCIMLDNWKNLSKALAKLKYNDN